MVGTLGLEERERAHSSNGLEARREVTNKVCLPTAGTGATWNYSRISGSQGNSFVNSRTIEDNRPGAT